MSATNAPFDMRPYFHPLHPAQLARKSFLTARLFCLFLLWISTNIYAKDTTFICETFGSDENYGPNIPQYLTNVKFTQQVLVKINMFENNFLSMSVEPLSECNRSQFLRCSYLYSYEKEELKITESELSFRKKFTRGISTWTQSTTFNRYTLNVDIMTNREYIDPPFEGLSTYYSGTCKK